MRGSARKIAVLLVVAMLAASVAGCKSSTPEESGIDSGKELQTVKIGFAAPLTGDNAIYGQGMQQAVLLAIEEANESEAVKDAGYQFEIQAQDDAGDPKQAVNAANVLVGDSDVVGIVGHFNSGCSIPAAPVYKDVDLAMVTVSSNPQLTSQGLSNVCRIVANDNAQGSFAGDAAIRFGYKKVALIDDATPYGQGLAEEFKKAFTAGGGEIISEERIQPKEMDFSALVTKIKPKAPDVVYYAGAHTEGALITKQLKAGGVTVPVMGGEMIFTSEYVKIAGESAANGDIATALGLPLEQQPRGAEFKTRYEAKYNKAPEAYDSYAYDAAWILINAVVSVGPDRAKVLEAARTGTLSDGVTGTVAFDENGDNKTQVISIHKVTDGEWKQIQE